MKFCGDKCVWIDEVQLHEIECGLEVHDRVSLAFLLCRPEAALKRCTALIDCCESESAPAVVDPLRPESKAAFVEALLLIGARVHVEKLGIDASQAKNKLRIDKPLSCFVHPMKKALYKSFRTSNDSYFVNTNGIQPDELKYLELFVLRSISRGEIELGSWSPFDRRPDDVKTVCDIGRLLDLVNSVLHKKVLPVQNYVNLLQNTNWYTSVPEKRYFYEYYPIHDPDFVGNLLIFNQETFAEIDEDTLSEREGTEVDAEVIRKCLGSFGFWPIVFNDLKHDEIESTIQEYTERVESYDSALAVCFLSHGAYGAVYASDSVLIEIDAIKNVINNVTQLVDKPKILIMQACRGDEEIDWVESDEEFDGDGPSGGISSNRVGNQISSYSDMPDWLVLSATIKEFKAYRSDSEGSPFIQNFSKIMMQTGDKNHLLDVFTEVNREVSKKKIQICQADNILNKKLQLKKIPCLFCRLDNQRINKNKYGLPLFHKCHK